MGVRLTKNYRNHGSSTHTPQVLSLYLLYYNIKSDIELDEYDDDNDGNFSARNDYSHWSCIFLSCQCQFIHLSFTSTVYL